MKRIGIASTLLLVFCSGILYGQNYYEVIRAELDAMYSTLEKDRVPTGLLRDYAIEEVNLDLCNGYDAHDTCAVTFSTFKSINNFYIKNLN